MRNVAQIVIKNLKLLMRSRTSALIIILAPLLVILLVGIAFDNSTSFGLTIGAYSESFGGNIEGLLSRLSEQNFKVIKYDNEQSCIEDIKLGVTNTCILFPGELSFESNQQKEVTFYVDYSKINLVWMIMDTLNAHFGSSAKEISKNLVKVLVDKLQASKTELEAKKETLTSLRTSNGEVTAKVQNVNGDLAKLNLQFNQDLFPTLDANSLLANITTNMTSTLSSAKSNLESAQTVLNGSSVDDKLNNAMEGIIAARKLASSESGLGLKKLATILTTIHTNLEAVRTEMEAANSLKSSAGVKLNEANAKLSESLREINSVEQSVDALINEINAIKVTNPEAIAEPFVTQIKPVAAQSTYLNYLFPSLIMLVVMFISILLSTTLVMMEKHSPAFFRNFITPTRDVAFIVAGFLTSMILVSIQLAIILGIAGYFFSTQIIPSLPFIVGILILSGAFFTFWGMAIGYVFTSEETATLAAISSGSIFLFISSVIVPLESMPIAIRKIVSFNPFVIAERLLRQAILFQPKIEALLFDLGTLAVYCIVLFVFIWSAQKVLNRHFLQKISYLHHKHKKKEKEDKQAKTHKKEEKKPVSFGLSVAPEPISRKKAELEEKLKHINEELKKLGK